MWGMLILIGTLLEIHHLYYSNLYLAKFFWLMCISSSGSPYSNDYTNLLMVVNVQNQGIVEMKDCNIVLPSSDQGFCHQTYFEAQKL